MYLRRRRNGPEAEKRNAAKPKGGKPVMVA